MTLEKLVVKAEGTTLDLLLWRRFRREYPGLVEDTFARNPGLAALGEILPVGAVVLVAQPDPIAAQARQQEAVSLYD